MKEHEIRLRGGWEWGVLGSPELFPDRLTLPVRWSSSVPRRLRLVRKFGVPPLEPGREHLLLRLNRVNGLRFLTLNGEPLPLPAEEGGRHEISIPPGMLSARNVLILDVEIPLDDSADSDEFSIWGEIALVIQAGDLSDSP